MAVNTCLIEHNIILPILYVLSIIVIVVYSIKYVRAKEEKKGRGFKQLWFIALSLYCVQLIYLLIAPITRATTCYPELESINDALTSVAATLFNLQYFINFLYLFLRLLYVFNQTTFRLSNWTKTSFFILYTFWIVLSICGVIVYSSDAYLEAKHFISWTFPAVYAMNITLLIMLSSLFIHKLVSVNQQQSEEHNQNRLLNTITKLSLLGFISLCSTLLAGVVIAVVPYLEFINGVFASYHSKFAIGIVCIIETLANFFSTLLTFNHFKSLYLDLCGRCDARCKGGCRKIGAKKMRVQSNMSLEIEEIDLKSSDAHII